jgi:hypothetical protein
MAVFAGHLTVSDMTPIPAGMTFRKYWRVENHGTNRWPIGSRLVSVDTTGSSPDNGKTITIPTEDLPFPGFYADVWVKLTAPLQPGVYTSYWRMADAEGNRFGERFRAKYQSVVA